MAYDGLKDHFNDVAGGARFSSYEERRWSADEKRKAQEAATRNFVTTRALPQITGAKNITELGPGPGTWTKYLYNTAPEAQFLLLDIAGEMLTRAKAALPESASVSTREGDFATMQLAPSAADAFFSSRAIEYVAPKETAVQSIYDHLAPGGVGIIITKMPKRLANQLSGRTPTAIHQGQISPAAFRKMLQSVGFKNIVLYPVTFSFPFLRSAAADRLLSSLFSSMPLNPISALFAESYGVVFHKP